MGEEKGDSWWKKGWKNKGFLYRYFAMLNICFLGLGAFVCFDAVGALQTALMSTFEIDFSTFSLMYSVNAWPNIVLSVFGGLLIDNVFGIKIGTILYGVVFALGHMIFSLGVLVSTYWCALLGRLISGLGAEFIYICLQIYSIHYFKGRELSMVMCVNISIARLGSSLVYKIADPLLVEIRKIVPGTESVGIVLFIVGSFILLTIMGGSFLACMSPKGQDKKDDKESKKTPKVTWRDFVFFSQEFWYILLVQVSYTVTIYVFLPFTQEFFKTMNGMTEDSANNVTSYFSIVGAVIAPFIGLIIHFVGKGLVFSKIGLIAAIIAHVILGFTTWSPYLSMFILSLSYALFNGTIIPMFAYIIPEYKLGTAYGVSLAFINASYALTVYLAGLIVDAFGYVGLQIFMLSFAVLGMIGSIALWIKDANGMQILNLTAKEIKIRQDKLEASAELKEPLKTTNNDGAP